MNSRIKIAGVVVLYHPLKEVLANIASYASHLEEIIVINNSSVEDPVLRSNLVGLRNCHYLFQGRNLGIAAALNLGAELAIRGGFHWLLTMDQDSCFERGEFPAFAAHVAQHSDAGILTPRHVLNGQEITSRPGWTRVRFAMTSGNLLNLEAYKVIGPFNDALFVDYVDYEYCIRLARHGYPVRRIDSVLLTHSLGNLKVMKLLNMVFRPTNHSPLRRYYITRNRLFVMSKFPETIPGEAFAWAKEMVKLILLENDRVEKLKMIRRGAADFFRKKFGPIE